MRKNYQMWLLGALFGGLVLPFAGCSNEDDPISNESGSGETFETELSIALSSGSGASTKASDDEVQANGDVFNGITGINLLSYEKTGISVSDYAPTGSENVLTTRFLADIPATSSFLTETGAGGANYVTYRQSLALNQAAQGFLFYGQSAYTPAAGKINATISAAGASLSGTTFDLVNLTPTEDYKTQMEEYLKAVYTALYNYNPDYVVAPAGGHSDNDVQSIYSSLNSAKSGSFVQIADLMAQLYVLADQDLLTQGASSSGLPDAIKTAINDPRIFQSAPTTSGSGDVEGVLEGMSYSPVTDGLATILGDNGILAAYYDLTFCEHGTDGSTGDFLAPSTTNTYTSPAALYYYVNTYPVDYSTGSFDALTWGGTTSGLIDTYSLVDLSTVSPTKIALAHSVQYGVGRLDVALTFESSLDDNDGNDGTTISSDDLTLKGVLIGNQKQVGWNFLPTASATDKVIYDNVVGTNAAKVLALPTENNAVVNIALELEYNDADGGNAAFIGANGQKIPNGSTFYVVGKLDPTDLSSITANPDNLQAVFVSDYTTTATLKLSSVKTAQNTVPDLSGTNLEFALSVNLQWNSGITFDVTIP